jgi:hypothetical protein
MQILLFIVVTLLLFYMYMIMEVDNSSNQKRKNSVVYLTQNILSDTQPCKTTQMPPISITTKIDDNGDTYNPYTSYNTYDPSDDYHTRQYTILKNNLY